MKKELKIENKEDCKNCNPMTIYQFASLGGKSKSLKKKLSARKNGRKGGRPCKFGTDR